MQRIGPGSKPRLCFIEMESRPAPDLDPPPADCSTNHDVNIFEGLASELRKVFSQCQISVNTLSAGTALFSIRPTEALDLTVEFSLSYSFHKVAPSISVISKSFTKKDVKRLTKYLELNALPSMGDRMLEEALRALYDFIEVEGFNEVCENRGKRQKKSLNSTGQIPKQVRNGSDENHSKLAPKRGRARRRLRKICGEEDDEARSADEIDRTTFSQRVETIEDSSPGINMITDPSARPTHFIAVRVTKTEIVEKLVAVQRDLVLREPLLEKGVFAPEIFHLTVLTVGIDTERDLENCISALERLKPKLEKMRPPNPFIICDMSQFYNRAVFASVTVDQSFLEFRECLKKDLENSDVDIRDQYEKYNPHVTLVKVKRPERRMFGSRNIQPTIYSDHKNTLFGEQMVEGLYLCPMDGSRREDGFYRTLCHIDLGS